MKDFATIELKRMTDDSIIQAIGAYTGAGQSFGNHQRSEYFSKLDGSCVFIHTESDRLPPGLSAEKYTDMDESSADRINHLFDGLDGIGESSWKL